MQKRPTYRFSSMLVSYVSRVAMFVGLLSFFVANIGLAVYTHVCSISGVQTSIFFNHDEVCGDDKHIVLATGCCLSPDVGVSEPHVDSVPCCSTETNYLFLEIDTHLEKTECKSIHTSSFLDIISIDCSLFLSDILYSSFYSGACRDYHVPKYQGRDLQSLHQVYII